MATLLTTGFLNEYLRDYYELQNQPAILFTPSPLEVLGSFYDRSNPFLSIPSYMNSEFRNEGKSSASNLLIRLEYPEGIGKNIMSINSLDNGLNITRLKGSNTFEVNATKLLPGMDIKLTTNFNDTSDDAYFNGIDCKISVAYDWRMGDQQAEGTSHDNCRQEIYPIKGNPYFPSIFVMLLVAGTGIGAASVIIIKYLPSAA